MKDSSVSVPAESEVKPSDVVDSSPLPVGSQPVTSNDNNVRLAYKGLLGKGINSVTGVRKGVSILSLDEHNINLHQADSSVNYKSSLISSYSDLYKQLNLNTSVNVSVTPYVSGSAGVQLMNEVSLNLQDVFLYVEIKFLNFTTNFQKTVIGEKEKQVCVDLLKKGESDFVSSHGDSYISETHHGKKLMAVIHFETDQNTSALDVKNSVDIHVTPNAVTKVGAHEDMDYKKRTSQRHKVANIWVTVAGASSLTMPGVNANIDAFYAFIDKFNSAEADGSVIDYLIEPYSTVLEEATRLNNTMTEMKNLFSKIDMNINELRFLKNSLQSKLNAFKTSLEKASDLVKFDESALHSHMEKIDALKVKLRDIANKMLSATDEIWKQNKQAFEEAVAQASIEIHQLKDKSPSLPYLHELTSIHCAKRGKFLDPQHPISEKVHINVPKDAKFLFWKIDSESNPAASTIGYNIKVKQPTGSEKKYCSMYKDISGRGQFLEVNGELGSNNKIIITKPKNHDNQPFTIKVSAVSDDITPVEFVSPIKR